MKNKIFTLICLALCTQVIAQNQLSTLIRGDNGVSNKYVTIPSSQQVAFAASQAKSIFGLDQNSDLVLKGTEQDQIGYTHYRFYQTYKGIPIENTMYIVHTKGGLLTGMSGVIVTEFDSQMPSRITSGISEKQAIDAALNHVSAQEYMWQDPEAEKNLKIQTGNDKATYYPSVQKVWYSGEDVNPHTLVLAYKVDVYSVKPLDRSFYFIDAQTGKVIGQKSEIMESDAVGTAATAYSGTQTIHSDLNGTSYRLRDYTKGNGILTFNQNGQDYTSPSPNWSFNTNDKYALDAHWGVSQTWQFYFTNYNRNSVDNAGYALTSYVNESFTVDNAYWDGSSMHFGVRSTNGAGVTAIDVTGHELTHGVTQNTSGLNYSKEPGAMNESMSDIMGKSVQFWSKPTDINWQLSNDMSWIIRDMSNPNAYGQPDTYLGTDWYKGGADNHGVHTNSGVGNFMFYLLVNGGSGTNDDDSAYSVTGIGLTEADNIIYRTETVYLTPTSQYADWRTACINAATDLYGGGSNELVQVENAWHAVGIGTAGSGGGCHDAFEPNNTRKTAAAIATGTNYNAEISTSGDVDWYTFTTTSSAPYIEVNLTGLPTDYDISLISSTGAKLGTSKNRGNVNEQIKYNTTSAGAYYVKINGFQGAFNSTQCYLLNVATSTSPFRLDENLIEQSSSMSIYPNPGSGSFTIDYSCDEIANATIKVYDLTGKIAYVENARLNAGDNTIGLKLNNLTSGMYFVELSANGQSTRSKLQIQK